MIECPEFDYDYEKSHVVYQWFLHVASAVSLLVNPLIIYCIIYHSSKQMKVYRWFLLLHQIAAFVADVWINLFAQAVILVPFAAGYLLGYGRYFLRSIDVWSVGQAVVVFEQATVMLQFLYRYHTVHRTKTLSFPWKCFLFMVVLLQMSNSYFPFTIEERTQEVFEQLAQNYTCITPRLQSIPIVVAVDRMEMISKAFGLVILDAFIFLVTMLFLTIGSFQATRTQNMSPNLRLMQQKFIFQLCLQSFIPFFVVIWPILTLVFLIIFEVFGCSWINDLVFTSGSLFGTISAVILFVMNPTYHRWLTRRFSSIKKIKLYSTPSVKSITQRC